MVGKAILHAAQQLAHCSPFPPARSTRHSLPRVQEPSGRRRSTASSIRQCERLLCAFAPVAATFLFAMPCCISATSSASVCTGTCEMQELRLCQERTMYQSG